MKYTPPLDMEHPKNKVVRPWGVQSHGKTWLTPSLGNESSVQEIASVIERRWRAEVCFTITWVLAIITGIAFYLQASMALMILMILTGVFFVKSVIYRLTEPKVEYCPLPSGYGYIVVLLDRLCIQMEEGRVSAHEAMQIHSRILQLSQNRKSTCAEKEALERDIHALLVRRD